MDRLAQLVDRVVRAPGAHGLRILGGTWMRAVAGFLPGSGVLTQRYAEHLFPDDDRRDEPAAYDLGSGQQAALLDLAELSVDPENDEFLSAEVLDGRRVLVQGPVHPAGGAPQTRHWLLDADTLRPLGRLGSPAPVGEDVTSLGDGTWLTHDGDRVHRWSVSRASS
ncbi:hypothetical protein OHB36_33445 [Streptomyces sp. NBC_00320]|uniref:hypothetical protein n=1 Tax=Streptomyces sp. NBC_00320 TaxID=2975711 RepID=UPI0022577454|nr:hypothetical protein [Streptomyces sp. NBC_00320]MCX5151607.1 hypothetical protein [Streptomyces sp. NBC_00320]